MSAGPPDTESHMTGRHRAATCAPDAPHPRRIRGRIVPPLSAPSRGDTGFPSTRPMWAAGESIVSQQRHPDGGEGRALLLGDSTPFFGSCEKVARGGGTVNMALSSARHIW